MPTCSMPRQECFSGSYTNTFLVREYCSYENQCHGNGSIQFQTSANNFGSRNRYFAEDEFDLTPCFASGAIGDSPIYDVIFSMTDLGHTLLRNHDFADHQFKARQFLTILHGSIERLVSVKFYATVRSRKQLLIFSRDCAFFWKRVCQPCARKYRSAVEFWLAISAGDRMA